MPPLIERLQSWFQYPLPHHWLSRVIYHVMRIRQTTIKNWLIRTIVRRYQVDMSLAQEPNPERYPDFNTFFTRPLRTGVRPIAADPNAIACPVDGTVSEAGAITHGRVYQAKGLDYNLLTLLGGQQHLADLFEDGTFATIYLSPRDYHRIHMPLTGTLRETVYVPGRLFSVNPATTRTVPGLFVRNERLVAIFDTIAGPMAMIPIGAIFVAGIETVWSGNYGDRMLRDFEHRRFDDQAPTLEKGAEMGRFNMGSTVILLFGPGKAQWNPDLKTGQTTRMGEAIAQIL
ncbi:MAG: phosphatidylserine decarboxylase [Gammaproteobacteria bacterium]|nr:phosphatidylserine decarboxylase [Gammaproteobacteria bacterium]